MKTWVHTNIVQLLVILVSITFGYAHFTEKINMTAEAQVNIKKSFEDYQREVNEKLDKLIRTTERIDERTKKL